MKGTENFSLHMYLIYFNLHDFLVSTKMWPHVLSQRTDINMIEKHLFHLYTADHCNAFIWCVFVAP